MEHMKVNLCRSFFGEMETMLVQSGNLSASAFAFPGGVCALRVKNAQGEMVILPFQGQQIWSARFCGRDLAMKSQFRRPLPTTDFLRTYGGFLLHCGATAMGVPSALDSHPLHGELPNMPYDEAHITIGEDEKGRYLAVGGKAQYTVAFATSYTAEPEVRLYEESTVAGVSMAITNLRSKPMEYMYLCHINYRPFEGSRLVYSAPPDREHIKVHFDIPDDLPAQWKEALSAYMHSVAEHPERHNVVDSATQIYDPEIVFTIQYAADADGYAHCMQVMPEGDACYVAFQPRQLPIGLRWISRTGDEDAMGMLLPATAEHKGYAYAKQHKQLKMIGANETVTFTMAVGYLAKKAACEMEKNIENCSR